MKFFYYSFNEYNKLTAVDKQKYTFLSTAKTHPSYFKGDSFYPFIPSKELFFDACKDFASSNYEQRYAQQIYKLNYEEILTQLKKYNSDIIVFLVWEAENKSSERDIFIPWITKTHEKDIKSFSFTNHLNLIKAHTNSIFDL
jgi:hypothetical protein